MYEEKTSEIVAVKWICALKFALVQKESLIYINEMIYGLNGF